MELLVLSGSGVHGVRCAALAQRLIGCSKQLIMILIINIQICYPKFQGSPGSCHGTDFSSVQEIEEFITQLKMFRGRRIQIWYIKFHESQGGCHGILGKKLHFVTSLQEIEKLFACRLQWGFRGWLKERLIGQSKQLTMILIMMMSNSSETCTRAAITKTSSNADAP